ncbi:coiled-coil domain-containing protein 50 isoform X1 [Kryptolebias marmoratus]|uniref:Coiled-coil domain containing 50a n=1 Tax=Kryptolebias marmoratus TaxID=37003 RepID=A0A3Q3BJ34_KRYMA|nr:coiled-coil domain-containing protein 50 isoform X1 [Kryptolebias marmoratus]
MAECNISIDKNKLPGVKEVCRDFAVLEDHSLAYNLQEQEIESHLASNVHKSRLVQQDLQVAKKLQKEEDEIAKIQSQKQNNDIERQDNEIAQEIQEELVRLEEQQRLQQEEEDAAIARQLQEKEKVKEEKRKQKQIEANFQEDYYEDRGAALPLDVDKHTRHKSLSPGRYDSYSPELSHRDRTPDYHSADPKRNRHPKQDSAAPLGLPKYPEHYSGTEGGRSRHADPYPEHLLPPRGRHEDGYPEFEPEHTGRAREDSGRDADRVVRRKERPARPPPPMSLVEKDEGWNRERQRHDRGRDYNLDKRVEKNYRRGGEKSRERLASGDRYEDRDNSDKRVEKEYRRDREKSRERLTSGDRYEDRDNSDKRVEKEYRRDREKSRERLTSGDRYEDRDNSDKCVEKEYRRDREKSRERLTSGDRYEERDRPRQKDKDRRRGRSRDRGLDADFLERGHSRDRPREIRSSWEEEEVDGERRARSRQRVHSNPIEVFDEYLNDKGRGDGRETWDPQHGDGSHTYTNKETGRIVHKGSGAVITETGYGLGEATQGLTDLDLRELELKDMEVARRLQEEELKASNVHGRAAQVAKDEELARRLAEHEKKEYRKNREREKERERLPSDRSGMEKRRHEGNHRQHSEEVVRPRTRDEYEYQRQRNHHKPSRPPHPRTHEYENVNSGYGYSGHPAPPRPTTRPDAAYRGASQKR